MRPLKDFLLGFGRAVINLRAGYYRRASRRTADAGVGTDGSRRDSWELMGERLATLWRDDAGVEFVTTLDLNGTSVWHTRIAAR